MRPWFFAAACAAALLAIASCEATPSLRIIKLVPQAQLPSGRANLIGGTLNVSATGLEPLKPTGVYYAWASLGEASVPLGAVTSGAVTRVALSDAELANVREVLVTEERSGTVLLKPSTTVRLRGAVGGVLDYVPVSAAQVAVSAGEVRLEDNKLTVKAANLPALDPGLTYSVWARFPAGKNCNAAASSSALEPDDAGVGDDAGMGDDAGVSDDAGMPMDGGMDADAGAPAAAPVDNGGRVQLGVLDSTGVLQAEFPYLLVTMQEVLIVVQSTRADPAGLSPVRVLRGDPTLPTPSTATHAHSH